MKKIAYKQMYDNELSHAWYISTRNLMIENISKLLKKNAKILEAGCGTGGTYIFLQKAGFKNVFGVDSSSEAIKFCKKRGIKKVVLASINDLPLKDKSFDAVICMDVLYHKDIEIDKVLHEFKRVLKPSGILYLQEPAFNWLKSRHDLAIQTSKRFSKKEIKSYLVKNSFSVLKISYFNLFLLPLLILKRALNKLESKKSSSSDVQKLPLIVNFICLLMLRLEGSAFKKTGLPLGLSIISISRKNA